MTTETNRTQHTASRAEPLPGALADAERLAAYRAGLADAYEMTLPAGAERLLAATESVNLAQQLRAALIREALSMGEAALCTSLPLERNMEYSRHRWAALVLRDILRGEVA